MNEFLLTPQDYRQALPLGLLGAGLGMLASNTGHYGAAGPALGQGGLLGLNAYQNALQATQQQKMQALQAQQIQGAMKTQGLQHDKASLEMQEMRRQIAEREKLQSILTGSGVTPGGRMLPPQQETSAPVQQPVSYDGGKFVSQPTPQQAPQQVSDNMRAALAQDYINRGQHWLRAAQETGSLQALEKGQKFLEMGTKFMPEVFKVEDAMHQGKPVQVMYFKDGSHAVMPFQPKPNYNVIDTGKEKIPVDLVTGQRSPAGAFTNQMTPGESDTSARGWASLMKPEVKDLGGVPYVITPQPQKAGGGIKVEKLPGAEDKPLTETQEKTYQFGNMAVQSENAIRSLTGPRKDAQGGNVAAFDPTGATASIGRVIQGMGDVWVVGDFMRSATNWMVPKDVQQYAAAVEGFIAADLYKASGAQITKDEFMRSFRRYIPIPGDDPATVAQKNQAREERIASLVSSLPEGWQKKMTPLQQAAGRVRTGRIQTDGKWKVEPGG